MRRYSSIHDFLLSLPGLAGMLVFGLAAAGLAPYIVSKAGTPEEVAERTVRLRRSGFVLMAAAAALFLLRASGWLK